MDITLIRTFIAITNTGSFIAASGRLFVTQSAVSLRIQRLEASIGHALFVRSKAGATLTPAGIQFEPYAISLLKIWEEARRQIAIPAGYSRAFNVGGDYSLWSRLGFRWLDSMQTIMPELSVHAESGTADRIMRFLVEGVVHAGLLHTPEQRPGLVIEPAINDELILVASYPDATLDDVKNYVAVDWGPEFTHALAIAVPHLTDSGRSMALGSLVAEYIINRRASAYLPARSVRRFLNSGKMHVVADAPRFPYPAWVVYREDLDPDLAALARTCLKTVVQSAEREQETVIEKLTHMTDFPPYHFNGGKAE